VQLQFLRQGIAALCAFIAPGLATAVDLPANLRVDGVIAPGARVPASHNDKILVINTRSGAVEGIGEVVDGQGTYFVMMGKDASFNDTPLTLRLQKANQSVYQLMTEGREASFKYKGTLFPSRLNLQLSVGASVGGPVATTPKPSEPQPTAQGDSISCDDPKLDVNGDGVCDQADIEIIKAYVAGQVRTIGGGARREDVNGDGVVNSRDLIDAMRAIRKQRAKSTP
jgi:hypothetical protein